MSDPRPTPAILSLGAYRPARQVPNEDIVAAIQSSDEWIVARSGIRSRAIAGPDEGLAEMAAAAAGKALGEAGVAPEQVSLVLVATMSNLRQAPPLAAQVAELIGARSAAAMDLGAACAGFCYGLAVAADAVRTGNARHVLLVGVERMSDIVDPTDRGTAFLFADGAGAAVVGIGTADGIGPVRWGSDTSGLDAIAQPYSWRALLSDPGIPWPSLRMTGQQVFRWALTALVPVALDAVASAGFSVDDVEVFVPHQANLRITDALVQALKLPADTVVARDIVTAGNTSAASIPLAMHQLLSSGQARSGQRALLIGFGSGLVYAAQLVQLP